MMRLVALVFLEEIVQAGNFCSIDSNIFVLINPTDSNATVLVHCGVKCYDELVSHHPNRKLNR